MLMSNDWPQKQMLTLRFRQKFSALELIEWELARDQERKIASRRQKEATFRQLHAHCHVSMSVRGRYFCLLSAGHLDVITVTPLSLAKKACRCVCVPEVQRVLELKGSAGPALIGVRQSGSLTHRKWLGAVHLIGKQRGMTIRSW